MALTLNRKQETAAQAFVSALLGDRARHDDLRHRVEALARSAFLLYSLEWGKSYDIRNWKWPIDELTAGRDFSARVEPWSALLAKAVQLVREIEGPQEPEGKGETK